MNTFYYLLEANAYLIIFYAFYKILLQKETFYSLNRYYLLGTSALAFALPVLDLSAIRGDVYIEAFAPAYILATETAIPAWQLAAYTTYFLISVLLFARLTLRIYQILRLVKSGEVITHSGFNEVKIKDKNLSFSFFNYLFINPELEEQNIILKHEQVHITQRHSLDILFFEIIHIINWFNPLIVFIKKDIKALHEFIADEVVSEQELGARNYAMFLIHSSYGAIQPDLSNQMFNQSLLKKRIMKLCQEKSQRTARLKYFLLPLLILSMLCISAWSFSKSYGLMDLMPAKYIYQDSAKKGINKPAPLRPKVENKKHQPPVVIPTAGKASKKGRIDEPVVTEVRVGESIGEPVVTEVRTISPQKLGQPEPSQQIKSKSIPKPNVERKKSSSPVVVPPKKSVLQVPPPPPAEPSKVRSIPRPKVENIKFPPPVVKPNKSKSNSQVPPPPPPVEPSKVKSIPRPKVENIKFPPPVVKSLKSKSNGQAPPPPPVEPLSKSIQGDPVKEKGKSEMIQGDPISE